ncbi:MAG: hypothetical protein OEW37_09335 [Rhodospirillaceae bacterium]|nr:hypothetical protein [Rhodospirillaceae bacterium]
MKRLFLILTCLLFVACAPPDDNHGYGYEYDNLDEETGLRERGFSSYLAGARTAEELGADYLALANCGGFERTRPAPLIIFVKGEVLKNGARVYGLYFRDTLTAVVSMDSSHKRKTVNHELMHHLNNINKTNDGHNSEHFTNCVN